MTQRQAALSGKITREMELVAHAENCCIDFVRKQIVSGEACLPCNSKHTLADPKIIGNGFKIKINANIGTSPDLFDPDLEFKKVDIAIKYGADAIMDLSTGDNIREIRRAIRERCTVPLGTVPIYQVACQLLHQNKSIEDMSIDEFFKVIEQHGEDGVDFITVHCGVTKSALDRLKIQQRTMGIVSRGGSFLARWMIKNKKENPLFEHYDRLLEIAREFDMTLSLGDGLRPGCLMDATDRAQIEELITLGELTDRALNAGVQVMVEGPGHVPMDQIEMNMKIQKSICKQAPFYVLGPIVTDIAPGYDHITSAIGGAIAAKSGADFLCYVTPAEHLRLPSIDDVKIGTIASKIAAHAADLSKNRSDAWKKDRQMAIARKKLDWDAQIACAIDPTIAREFRSSAPPMDESVCSMCGKYCAIKGLEEVL
ncbi:phosphomethylpyrimidine synthase ThiC [bacterium]|nr:phosphomethylpyrimidine synthase ThiC [candidate division CSSED10-310 bacterium]